MSAQRWALWPVAAIALLVAVFAVRAWVGRSRGAADPVTSRPEARAGRSFAFRVEAQLEQLSERNPDLETSRLTVVLRDPRGKEVETPDIRLELGGVPLSYAVRTGNFYDRHPYYRLEDDSDFRFAADTTYELVARRGEEPAMPLARLRTPKPFGPGSFRLPASPPGDADLEVSWTGLPEPADLLVTRTIASVDGNGNEVLLEGGPYGDDVLRRRIGSRGLSLPEGRSTIPASYLEATGGGRVTSLRLEVTVAGDARFLCRVLEPSTVSAVRKVVLPVDVGGPRSR